ncbi:alpha/beta hydrolase [Pseudooceanicola onchidii]|uniref:alpha/beta hydrolase n=1 Tax=Pseudooceanicola onchidii TaxID=2562279 RepID=UPI0010AB46DA|nr:alpha/beta fold hydrolase [Pseudooceanicola onchidii]
MVLKVLTIIGISVVITGAIALGLILSDRPKGPSGAAGLDFDRITGGVAPLPVATARLRDGSTTLVRHLTGPEGAPLVVLVHGSGWDGGQFDAMAAGLSRVADVLVPDLRGHGAAPDRRGDVDYIGQMEDDLVDLLTLYIRYENQKVVLLGHSSGGGLVIRFANGAYGPMMDRAVLLAPFVQYDAPMTRKNSGGWARPLMRRIVGLSMLNGVGIHALDHLVAMEFNMPQLVLDGPQGHRATTAYSWRLNQGYAPRRDWQADVAALPDFLLIAGAEDEAFVAEGYAPAFSAVTDRGRYEVLPGIGHLDVVNDPQVIARVAGFLADE